MGHALSVPLVVGMAGTGYLATSVYLLVHPLSRLRACPTMPHVPLIAHRGGAAEGYENTMSAFRKAVNVGAGMLELDVHLSKDGQAVVAHDSHLLRVSGINQNIRNTDFNQLPPLKERVPVDFCPGLIFDDKSVLEKQRRFSTLEAVIKEFPSTQINIDLKDKNKTLVHVVNKIIVENNAEDRCVWGNFSRDTTESCYLTNPRVGLLFSSVQFLKLYLLFYTGLLPFIKVKETHLEIPMPSVFLDEKFRSKDGNVGLAKFPPWLIKMVDWLLMSRQLFLHLDKRGITTYLWVLNSEDQYEKAFKLGVHGVMTDYPSKLKQFLEKKGK